MQPGVIGQASIVGLIGFASLSVLVHGAYFLRGTRRLRRLGQWTMVGQFLFAAIASAVLITLLIQENLSYAYVAEYTGPGLPLIYKIAAFWGGNAGSLLLWEFVLTIYGLIVAYSSHEDSRRMVPIVSFILSLIALFYDIVLSSNSNPFERLAHPATVGNGLNPLLQNPGMTVHPVNIYLGYIGFSIPFAYAMAGLILRKTDATWLKVTRRWTLISWLFLSMGILYGAHWSYEELGWGGYWAWDPVENASLLPWLTGTAFLHSAIVQERRGMLKAWNVILVTLTFLLTILGTFLTRSGVLWSIHAFANAPLGRYFLLFFIVVLIASALIIIARWSTLRAEKSFEAVVSKETSFMLNNVLFLGSMFAVLWGTVFPIISEAMTGQKMMVSGPFYNKVNLPLGICIIILMGVGPVIAWRRASVRDVVHVVVYPFVVSIALALLTAAGLRFSYGHTSVLGTMALVAAYFVFFTVFLEFYRGVKARVELTGEGPVLSFIRLVSRNRRRYGGYVVHLAVAIIAIGIAGSGAYHLDVQQELRTGQTAHVGAYDLTFEGMAVAPRGNDRQLYGDLVVRLGGQTLGVLRPSATFYANGQTPSTGVALYSTPLRDLYVVMLGTSQGDSAVFDMHVNPLVQWIWFGGYLFIVGTVVSLWPESHKRLSLRTSRVAESVHQHIEALYQELAELEYDHRMGKVEPVPYEEQKQRLLATISGQETEMQFIRRKLEIEVDHEIERGLRSNPAGGTSL